MTSHAAANANTASRPNMLVLIVRRAAAYLLRADSQYRQICHLRELDDRLLRDIGVTRADVEHEVRRIELQRWTAARGSAYAAEMGER